MRLLMTTDAVGGVWTFTQELSAGLLASGNVVALACVGRPPSAAQMLWVAQMHERFDDAFAFTRIDAPLEWEQDNAGAFVAAAGPLLRIARDFGAELIHSNQYCFGALAGSLPVVITAHSDVLSWAAGCGTQLEDSAWLRHYKALTSEGLRGACALTAPTRWMLNALATSFALPMHQAVIANGRALPEAPEAGVRKLQAITAGRVWDPAKNTAMLAEVGAAMPILIAGEFAYQAAGVRTSLGAAKLLGPLAESDLLGLMRESAIYLCTSRYEPFGLAPLEAALCGCAVLCNDIASLREVWGDAALYFQDAASLSALLHELAADPVLLGEVQTRCAERARGYTREAMAAGYLALYQRVTHARESCRAA